MLNNKKLIRNYKNKTYFKLKTKLILNYKNKIISNCKNN